MPLNDRDYMQRRPSGGNVRHYRPSGGANINAVWVIIGLNLILLIITMVSSDALLRLGVNPDNFWTRPWTIISAMFTHSGIMHFIFNMIVLFFFGRFLIMLVGQNWFLTVYFTGGIIGNILFLLLGDGIAVGASGAVYAIAGALVLIVPNMRVLFWGIIPMPLWVFVVVFLGILSLPGIAGSNIAWQAHLGGLVVGLIAGYFFRRTRRYSYR